MPRTSLPTRPIKAELGILTDRFDRKIPATERLFCESRVDIHHAASLEVTYLHLPVFIGSEVSHWASFTYKQK